MIIKLNLMDTIRICREKNGFVFYGVKKTTLPLKSYLIKILHDLKESLKE